MISDPEVLAFVKKTEESYPADANLATAEDNRRYYNTMCAVFRRPCPANVETEDRHIDGVPVRNYRKKNAGPTNEATATKVMYLHGGGYVVGSLESHDDVCAELCDVSGLEVIAVDYRLAPEYQYPAQIDDVERVWREITTDGRSTIIMGDSAGGNLCAALSSRMKRLNGPMPRGQILIYPSLTGDHSLPSYSENAEAPLLRTQDILAYKPLYVGDDNLSSDQQSEIAPAKSANFSHLPPTWVITADVDPLRDDGPVYVAELLNAGVFACCINEPQLVHGYLRARHMSKRANDSFKRICMLLSTADQWAT
ncbi:lipase [Brucella pseudogrignonensis]|nr:alpha/beta hydrolase fold domain-containing protein [Ochrobactrum sp. MYb237]PQZ41466.1 lipase [Brucella pseudogrignonensis]PRA37436.1 lipase [Brucella pseudogrignonensis]PRA62342.1 lipase [Brucella pseudogrignonensis]